MKVDAVQSYNDLMEKIAHHDTAYLLLYKSGAEQSECALNNLQHVEQPEKNLPVYMADVSVVRDIHEKFGVTSAPSLLSFEKGKFQNIVKGCNDPLFYKSFFENTVYSSQSNQATDQKRVVVYSTPTCSWCNTLKSHLRKNGIRFTDVDISKDPKLAEELVRKTGQQGVPQTEIEGEIIVGFDKTRINRLLNIQN